jgi:hypothetical protein
MHVKVSGLGQIRKKFMTKEDMKYLDIQQLWSFYKIYFAAPIEIEEANKLLTMIHTEINERQLRHLKCDSYEIN